MYTSIFSNRFFLVFVLKANLLKRLLNDIRIINIGVFKFVKQYIYITKQSFFF